MSMYHKIIEEKKMYKTVLLLIGVVLLSGCGQKQTGPETQAESKGKYSYVPTEPSSVNINICNDKNCSANDKNCTHLSKTELLRWLPDNAVRMSIRQTAGSAKAGSSIIGLNAGIEGNSYSVIIDFANSQTINYRFGAEFEKNASSVCSIQNSENKLISLELMPSDSWLSSTDECKKIFNIPVYVGIGVRLKADIDVLKGNVDLTGLSALSAAVKAEQIRGAISIQSLGISGKNVYTNLTFPTKLDETTIQNAIQTLSTIKASIDSSDIVLTPRVLGFQNTIGADENMISRIYSELVKDGIDFNILANQSAINP